MEILYIIWRAEGEEPARHALRLIDSFNLQWIACDADILENAARLKARGNLSVADSWIAATAIVHGATLLHKDPEFEGFNEIKQEALK
jgi:predicted nucleic acid-binding protein